MHRPPDLFSFATARDGRFDHGRAVRAFEARPGRKRVPRYAAKDVAFQRDGRATAQALRIYRPSHGCLLHLPFLVHVAVSVFGPIFQNAFLGKMGITLRLQELLKVVDRKVRSVLKEQTRVARSGPAL